MLKYWIAAGFLLFFIIASGGILTMINRKQSWARNIIAHICFIIASYGVILTVRQITLMLLLEYQVKFITSEILNTCTVIAMLIVAVSQTFQLINRLTHDQIRKGSDPTSSRMIARILKMTIVLIIILLFGEHFGIGLSGLMAFGGIGGIAIGVAGKDILSNVFSGIMLYFDRPFNIGDWISSPDRQIEGTVVEIGWRISKIMTFDHRPLYVPNYLFSTISVENPGRMTNRRINTSIGLRYEDAGKIAGVVEDIQTMIKSHPKIDQTQTILVYFDEFADSSLNIMIYCFTKTTVWAEWLAVQQDVYLKMIDIVQAHGADFAFQTQTLYIEPNQTTAKIEKAPPVVPSMSS